MADSNIRILAPERVSAVPAVPGQKALAEVPKKAAGIEAPGGTLGRKEPERATYPFGPRTRAWLEKHMPIAVYGAKCVADADRNAQRAKALAESRS